MSKASRPHHIALDSWRGLAALMVVLHHFATRSPIDGHPLLANAWLCVDLFFVLSGFVIAATYREALAAGLGVGPFMLLRLGRLYPLHFVMLVLFVAAEAGMAAVGAPTASRSFFSNATSPWAIVTNLLLVQGIGVHDATATWNTVAWSVSTEFAAYVVFALLAATMPRRLWVAMLAVIAVSLVFIVPESIRPAGVRRFVDLARCLYGFSVGVLLRYAYEWLAASSRVDRVGAATFSGLEFAALAVALAFLIEATVLPAHVLAPLAFAPLILVYAFDRGHLSRVLHAPLFVEFGILSYSIYMVHLFLQARVMQPVAMLFGHVTGIRIVGFDPMHNPPTYVWGSGPVSGVLLSLVMLFAVIRVSRWTYRCIESPARLAVRRHVDRNPASEPAAMRPQLSPAPLPSAASR